MTAIRPYGQVARTISLSQILYILRRWTNRGQMTSVEHFADYLAGAQFINHDQRFIRPYTLLKWISQQANHERYSSISSGLELASFVHMLRKKSALVHYLYGEYDMHYAPYFGRLINVPVVASFHNPPKELALRLKRPSFLRGLSGIVIHGNNQGCYFEKFCPNVPITLVPLGVDTEFFSPTSNPTLHQQAQPTVLIVGVHLRDWQLVHEFLYGLRRRFPNLQVQCVVPREYEAFLPQEAWVKNTHPVTDDQLREIYRQATLMLYAPLDCVGSNAVVEALACGVPIVAPDVGAVRDYVLDGTGFVLPRSNVTGMVEVAEALIEDQSMHRNVSREARNRSLDLDWNRIREQYFGFYEQLGLRVTMD